MKLHLGAPINQSMSEESPFFPLFFPCQPCPKASAHHGSDLHGVSSSIITKNPKRRPISLATVTGNKQALLSEQDTGNVHFFFLFSHCFFPQMVLDTKHCMAAQGHKNLTETWFFSPKKPGKGAPESHTVWGKSWRDSWIRKSPNSVYDMTQIAESTLSCVCTKQTKNDSKGFEN